MIADGVPFTGFLYAGLMIDAAGAPKVIEFNVRFGDPETQPVMLRLQSDLLDLVEAAIDARLHEVEAQWDPRPSLGVVMAAENYPGTPRARRRRSTPGTRPDVDDTKVFHAGTALEGEQVVTSRRPRAVRVRAGRHAWPTRSAAPMPKSPASPGTANSTATTSAGARSSASAAEPTRSTGLISARAGATR